MTLTRILLADDEKAVQTVAKIALEQVGHFEVKLCQNGKEVMKTVADWKPDLILLDVMMPVMDGPMTLKYLRQIRAFADIPVIFLIDKLDEQESEALQSLGAIGVISKPFNPLKLVDTLKQLWRAARAA